MALLVLIPALLVVSALFLAALLLVPAWLLDRFLCEAHALARRELLASRESSPRTQALRLVTTSHGS